MELKTTAKFNVSECLILLLLLGFLANWSQVVSAEQLQNAEWTDEDVPDGAYLQAFREELRRELASFAEAEAQIAAKMRDLEDERKTLRTKKRGHTQCFLNLVSCYRKRK